MPSTIRDPNFKIGWFIDQQVAALTHFHSDITPEDMRGVIQGATHLLAKVDHAFHLIIDNREANMPSLMSLKQLRAVSPIIQHPYLRLIVVVKPKSLDLNTHLLEVETLDQLQLKNVSSVQEAIDFLRANLNELFWDKSDGQFFPP